MSKAKRVLTRAQYAGVNANAYARKVERFVDQTRERIQRIAYEWDEVCSGASAAADALSRALDEFHNDMKDYVAYIKEPPDNE